jgi:hypothetical protein
MNSCIDVTPQQREFLKEFYSVLFLNGLNKTMMQQQKSFSRPQSVYEQIMNVLSLFGKRPTQRDLNDFVSVIDF